MRMKESSEKSSAWVLALTSVASFMVALDGLVVTTALSTIRVDLGASLEALEWTVNAYLLSIALVPGRIRESFGPGTSLDIRGLVLVTGAALGVVWGLVRGNSAGWSSPEVVAALVAGLVLAAAFVVSELGAREPMVPIRFFRYPAFASGHAATFLYSASLYGTLFFMAQFLQTAQGHGPLGAGLRLLPWTATLFVVAPIAGGLVSRLGERPLVAGGLI